MSNAIGAGTHQRTLGRRPLRAAAGRLAVPLCACASLPSLLWAQVGHPPERSPFRDVTTRQGLSVAVGRFAGNATVAGVGALPGLLLGLRLDSRLSGPMDFWVSAARIASRRRVIDATREAATRVSGPIDLPIIAADVGLGLNLTGAKSWHNLAPYLGVGLGVVQPTQTRTDPGGYRAGTNFSFVPTVGTRWFLGRTLALRLEARDYYFRYEWPLAYYEPTETLPPILDGSVPGRQWAHNFALVIGVMYVFTF